MATVSQTGSRPGALEAMIHRSNDVGELLREDDSLLRQQFFAILREHSPKVMWKQSANAHCIYQMSALLIE